MRHAALFPALAAAAAGNCPSDNAPTHKLDCTPQCFWCENSSGSCEYIPERGDDCNLNAPLEDEKPGKCIPKGDAFECVPVTQYSCAKLTGDAVDAGKECVVGDGTCVASDPETGASTDATHCLLPNSPLLSCSNLADGDPCWTKEEWQLEDAYFSGQDGGVARDMDEVCFKKDAAPLCTPVADVGCVGKPAGAACTLYRFAVGASDALAPSQCSGVAGRCATVHSVASKCTEDKCSAPEVAACADLDLSDACSFEDVVRKEFRIVTNKRWNTGKDYSTIERASITGTCKLLGGVPACEASSTETVEVLFGTPLDQAICDELETDVYGKAICVSESTGQAASARALGAAALLALVAQ